ncbi:DUF2889 domain-containing protein [Frankia sp. QA3]|uniref:DUF2889 domain-containing protein n=1 Tax=Frankia sp. QA3 TaxID=710111 RepID=UPI000269BE94|nr:DUF2889 domain-containing protein [Frankia sp. QA3]EIV91444.1 Protein of unknown function (DUF2889) [Frankia sp. QA3]
MPSPVRPLPALADLVPPPDSPHRGAPRRVPGSVRRTSHLNATWPDGFGSPMHLHAGARDLVTGRDRQATVVDSAQLRVTVDGTRTLRSLTSVPPRRALSGLVGHGGGRGYRARVRELVPEDVATGSPLHFLLDDMPGATLVGPIAWRLWPREQEKLVRFAAATHAARVAAMREVCSGWRVDGGPLERLSQGDELQQNLVPAHPLEQPDDPLAWHRIPAPPGDSAMFRRRRRVDVIAPEPGASQGVLTVDSMFRDSMWSPQGVETVVHEYGVHATVDPATLRLVGIHADPRVLPFETCPSAAGNVDLLLGEPVGTLRARVIELVAGTDGCTHLNDALRALAEVPVLVDRLVTTGRID